jgi:ADP-ribose pyrophosphatase YjhB (NUDIX family)
MTEQPLGPLQNYCSKCGAALETRVPDGDNKLRYVCAECSFVHYDNPKIVTGAVVEHEGQILLCKRAIEPRRGYWTVPAGFMELGETVAQGASRETLEEACAQVRLGSLLAVVDVPEAGQVHMFYRATMTDGQYASGEESLDTRLFAPADIPWDEIAFRSGHIALTQYLEQKASGIEMVHMETATRLRKDGAV